MDTFTPHKGFTIFFAVLVASLALAVGLSIYDILSRELALSTAATQSQYAIYAADTGAECALYWDIEYSRKYPSANDADGSAFATSSDYTRGGVAGAGQIYCNGQDITAAGTISGVSNVTTNSNAGWYIQAPAYGGSVVPQATTTFQISLGTSAASPCALVTVAKSALSSASPSQTIVVAHGYNTCTAGVDRFERALQVNY